jgi:hypothetical protein
MHIEQALTHLGPELRTPLRMPPGTELSFPRVRVTGNWTCVSGHALPEPGGTPTKPLGNAGAEADACRGARPTALAILSSLPGELGDLNRACARLRILGMGNAVPGTRMPTVTSGFPQLRGLAHGVNAHLAAGPAELLFGIPTETRAGVQLRSGQEQ